MRRAFIERRQFLGAAVACALCGSLFAGPSSETPRRDSLGLVETLPQGALVRVTNPFGTIRARFGGYEHRLELAGTRQSLDADLPALELRTREVDAGLEVSVLPRGASLPYSGPERLDRVDLVVYLPQGASLVAETVADLIEVKGVKGAVEARSRLGEIRLRSVDGAIRAHTDRGKILAVLSNGATDREQSLSTETGEIEVFLWQDARLRVDLATSGEISTDFSLTVEHRPTEEPGKYGKAILGGGGPPLILRSKRGKIKLSRLARDASSED